MKTILKSIFLIATFLFFSCGGDDDTVQQEEEQNLLPPLTFTCDEIRDLLESDYVFEDRGSIIDYIIPCKIDIDTDVKINPGVTIAFENEGGFNVRNQGSLNAVGTAQLPIIITSTELTKGDWKGILFDSDDNKNILEYVTIANAGGGAFNSNGDLGAIITWAGAQLTVANCTIIDSESLGINMNYREGNISISNTRITGCTFPIQGYSEYMDDILGGDYSGNETDAIRVIGSGSNSSGIWTKLNVPYRLNGKLNVNNVSLTIAPGVILEFENGAWFDVGDQSTSTFKAVGTPSERILFTGVTKQPGSWKGIRYEFTNSPENEISFATIEYAGATTDFNQAAIYIWAEASLKMDNVLFKDIPGCGIWDSYNPNVNFNGTNLTFENTGGTICGN
ncbi:MAG: hypothetical protein ACSHW7_08075 [Patiriisocius sp.]|uniref:hypothetical protein n=1 Tax=Patiriisocius sp. TaxID=2822396 RepID=UPI003EF9C6C5